jgi:hypothetical protein
VTGDVEAALESRWPKDLDVSNTALTQASLQAMMVAAALIATITFAAMVLPPGGVMKVPPAPHWKVVVCLYASHSVC